MIEHVHLATPLNVILLLFCIGRSETMEGYLRCMLVADLAIEAQVLLIRVTCF